MRLDGARKAETLKISHIVCPFLKVVCLGFHTRIEKREAWTEVYPFAWGEPAGLCRPLAAVCPPRGAL